MSITTLATSDPKRFDLLEGQQHPYTIADRWTVVVQCVRYDAAYTVRVEQGSLRLDDLCGSYPTEQEACAIARGYCQMFLAEAGR